MRFPNSFLDEIRDRVPISQVIGTRVTFDRRKTNASRGDYWACCPFHGEKSPSFHCEDRKGRYHCFGCGVSGDHFRFLSELDGISFPEAVERIADMAGVPMPQRDPQAERREQKRASLSEVMEMAAGYFQSMLQEQQGAEARAYLRSRGLSSATQQSFRIGYAPSSRNALKEFLAGKGVGKDQIEACGLVVFGPDIPVSYDRFRDRIMFPIEDARGRVIAFGGRAMSKDVPAKYLNSPDTELFHKGTVLYNLARARRVSAKGDTVIAVEGYMDVIGLAQAGFENAVAPLGTALTENQLELLWRMTGEPVLCFDGDEAGLRAAWRAADLALPVVQPGRSLRFALLPEGKDPDDLVREEGPDAFAAVLSGARPLADMLWMRETSGKVFDTPERRAELERNLQALTAQIRDENLKRHYSQDMRERARTFFGGEQSKRGGQRGYRDGGGGGGRNRGFSGRPGGASGRLAVSESLARSALVRSSKPAMPLREATLLVTLVNHPGLLDEYFDALDQMLLASADLGRLRMSLLDAVAHNPAHDRDMILKKIEDDGLVGIWKQAEARVKGAYMWPALENAALDDAREAFAQTLYLHRRAGSLHKELKAAELALANDWNEEDARHLTEIQAELSNLQATEALIEGFGLLSGRANRS
ncbi:DNA primase [Nitratireductor aquimarinus]|uniref:DNA primase n=1 Tax=Nitratireductor aquimarinus TaxID=889300 RepID=A0ABU4AFR9_9HYPH|nr:MULTISPECIES: DNA primase [Alphaproteobacteria]MBY6022300.1 DNA primase [Nitratireductor sp. DP7N14-4]MBN7757510.1 DNA primase [Nitratireductor aquimarinus]MBN7774901.1 DNA primase [Nitratireductor pacificus]MBN7779762.1 DNA primase [Nitratireductor pacificus]MBN7788569.1 DNA primase [Nitratireductor aquimarinus]